MALLTLFVFVFVLDYVSSQTSGCGKIHIPGSTTTHTIQYAGISRTYIVHVPSNYALSAATPVIYGFPGYTISANYFSNYFGLNQFVNGLAAPAALAVTVQATSFQPSSGQPIISWNDIGCSSSPGPEGCSGNGCNLKTCTCGGGGCQYSIPSNCPQNGCNWCNCNADDIGFINYLAGFIETEYCIDVTRQYALGYSQGGMMANRIGCSSNNRFAAIAPFAGQQPRGFGCSPEFSNGIGIFNVWGTRDNVVPGDGETSNDGFFYLPVADIQQIFADHNGCNTNTNPVPIATQSDGIESWTCTGYTAAVHGCNNNDYTIQCSYNGNHNYPKYNPNNANSENFALPSVWDYFQDFVRMDLAKNISKKYYK